MVGALEAICRVEPSANVSIFTAQRIYKGQCDDNYPGNIICTVGVFETQKVQLSLVVGR